MENYSWPWDLSERSAAPPCWSSRVRKASFICLLPSCTFTESRWDLNFQCMYLRSKSCNISVQILPYFFRPEEKWDFQAHLHHNNSIVSHSPFSLDLIMLQFKSEAAEPNEMDPCKRTLWPQDMRGVPHQSVLRGKADCSFRSFQMISVLVSWLLLPLPPKSAAPYTFLETCMVQQNTPDSAEGEGKEN